MAAAVEAVRERTTHEGKPQQTLGSTEDCREAVRSAAERRPCRRRSPRTMGNEAAREPRRSRLTRDRRDYRAPQISR